MAQANELIFLSMTEAYSSFTSIMTRLERLFVKYHYRAQQRNFPFSQIGEKTIYLSKDFPSYIFMYVKPGNASTVEKKTRGKQRTSSRKLQQSTYFKVFSET
jgi:hypothetical protein